jgi:sirohydrochlorin ferrochelatase
VDDEVVKAVHHRIEDTGVPIEQAKVVLIGRGSTDPAVKNAVSEIAGKLEAITPVKEVIPCFLTACDPHYKEVFAGLEEDDGAPVFIVPYLLFTGLLMTEIEREVQKLQTINQNVHLASYLGFHPHIKQAFLNRVSEAVRNPGGQFDFKGGQYAASAH